MIFSFSSIFYHCEITYSMIIYFFCLSISNFILNLMIIYSLQLSVLRQLSLTKWLFKKLFVFYRWKNSGFFVLLCGTDDYLTFFLLSQGFRQVFLDLLLIITSERNRLYFFTFSWLVFQLEKTGLLFLPQKSIFV